MQNTPKLKIFDYWLIHTAASYLCNLLLHIATVWYAQTHAEIEVFFVLFVTGSIVFMPLIVFFGVRTCDCVLSRVPSASQL